MKTLLFTAFMALTLNVTAAPLTIIPKPAKSEVTEGHYTHIESAAIRFPRNLAKEAELLAAGIEKITGKKPKLYRSMLRIFTPNAIHLSMDGDGDWQQIAKFANGIATGTAPKGTTQIRVRATKEQKSWLIIREIDVSNS